MTFAKSFYNQSSVLSISVMVVDDDPVFLQIMARMLEKFKYRDPSVMEIRVIAVKDSMEALSTLKIQRNNIDLIVTDYYMPGMNGLQLKSEINREFGNLPVIVMSSDTNKEQESLSCGAMCFIQKPIKATDLTKIYQLALTYKRNGKSILWTDHNHNDTDHVSVPQHIQLLPEQANVSKTKKKWCSSRSDSRSVNSTNESCVSTDGSRKKHKRKRNGSSGDDLKPSKKSKITWTDFLHDRFLQAIRHIGLDKAVPKKILEFMNVSYLTRENVASHLQKYRIFLRKVAEKGLNHSSAWSDRDDIESTLPYTHMKELYYNYFKHSNSWYDSSLNDRSFYSRLRHGLGQSRLLSNTREPFRFNYNYVNRSSTYEPRYIGSNLTLPIKSNLNFSNQPSHNEARRSFLEPPVMANKISQTSQVLGFGQHGSLAVNGNNSNNNMMSSYGSSTLKQPSLSNYGSLTPNQSVSNNYGSSTLNQPGLTNYGSLTPNQSGLNNYGSSNLNQPGPSNYGSLTPKQSGFNNYGSSLSTKSRLSNYGGLTLNQSGLYSYGSSTLNQPEPTSYGGLNPNQPGPSHFSYGMQSFLNNENAAYEPQAHANTTTQPNLEIPQLENLSLYGDIGKTNELPCNISNFQFDHNKQQGEAASNTEFELPPNFPTELNQILSLEDDVDWTFENINQDHYSNGETSNALAAPETNSTIFNMNPNHNQEQDVPDFIDWSLLDPQDLVDDDFMDSLFNNDMN